MGVRGELEIRAEWYQRDLLEKAARTGKRIMIPVDLYKVYLSVPFAYRMDQYEDGVSVRVIIYGRQQTLVYYGPLGTPKGFDAGLLLALGLAVPKEQLRKPYTFFEKFVKEPDGTVLFNKDNTGLITLDGVAAYGSRLFAQWTS